MASCQGEMEQLHRDVCCKHFDLWQTCLPQEVTDSGGGKEVDAIVVSNTDPDETTIKTQELTFNHQSIPVIVQCTYLADPQNNSKKAES